MSVSEELKRLHELHQAGALSDEEFARAKESCCKAAAANRLATISSPKSASCAVPTPTAG